MQVGKSSALASERAPSAWVLPEIPPVRLVTSSWDDESPLQLMPRTIRTPFAGDTLDRHKVWCTQYLTPKNTWTRRMPDITLASI